MKALIDEEIFVRLKHCTWLYSGAKTPSLRGQARAMEGYILGTGEGPGGSDLPRPRRKVMAPSDPGRRARNIPVICPRGEDVAESLCRRDVYRWGGDSRPWASVHAFNDRRDTFNSVEALETQRG